MSSAAGARGAARDACLSCRATSSSKARRSWWPISARPASVSNTVCNAGTFTADDLWIRVGQRNLWDVKVGRFEGWEIYHLGMGLDSYTLERMGARMVGADSPATSPRLDAPRGLRREPPAGTDPPTAWPWATPPCTRTSSKTCASSLLGKLGTDKLHEGQFHGRHPLHLSRRPLSRDLRHRLVQAQGRRRIPEAHPQYAGRGRQTAQKKDSVEELVQWGAGGSAQFVIDPIVEFGVSAAYGNQSYTDATGNVFESAETLAKSYTTMSVGGFAQREVR